MSRIAVIGGGAWGTALAAAEARAGRPTVLWARDPDVAAAIRRTGRNERFLPGIDLPAGLGATADLADAVRDATLALVVVPAQALRDVMPALAGASDGGTPLVLCAKGIERGSGLFPSAVAAEFVDMGRLATLSGPSFAADVAQGLPTAVTLAARDEALADALARQLSAGTFRIYASTDLAGVEAGGALKNVLAIAAGIVAGRGLGASAGAAIVTRGLAELRRLGQALGGRPETLAGLSGLGDLVLTCSGPQSRNFAYGLALGRGEDLTKLKLAEGVFSAAVAAGLADRHGIDAPIVETVAAILAGQTTIEAAIEALLSRPLKREDD
ncbi:NAD(P)H-dependent glycerol-3-phosphate dehydrogenase [Aureimonas leprariae]|uniref:NAD(P)H-dependent glycerol-3-phosphate dehydrogenase n=1 Tax=Plantimonas leprariae TaxID=2615207 RepID=UPI0013875659|nr:NAD(P)H-dependent glycerol-3-phosphate dehydrogenase [Aureimonas leprariae]